MKFGLQVNDTMYCIDKDAEVENTKVLSLHDWQRRAIKYFYDCKFKVIYSVPTGCGKTFFAIQLMKKIFLEDPNIKVLIVCPKNVILERTWYKELYEAGISLKDIGVYYGEIKEKAKITITNIQNLENINFKEYQMQIWDEIHWSGTDRILEFLSLPCKYKIGLSATLKRLDNKHYEIMEHFNYNIFSYEIHEALNDDIISFFDFYSIGVILDNKLRVEYDEITEKLNNIFRQYGGFTGAMKHASIGTKNALLGLMNERKQLVNNYHKKFDVVKKIISMNKESKTLIFNQYNKTTSSLYWTLLEEGCKAEIMHSGVEKKKREEILTNFKKDKFLVLLCSRVIDEGYNLPSIDCAIIMSNESSGKRQLIQRIGRTLRKSKGKLSSKIFLIYCKDTIEENTKNISFLKNLCSDYKEKVFNHDEEIIL